jgi:hypothetical protein
VRVFRNVVAMPTGQTGLANDTRDASLYTSNGNRFDWNTYRLGCNRTPFAWARTQGSGDYANVAQAAWVEAGNDRHGRFDERCPGGSP